MSFGVRLVANIRNSIRTMSRYAGRDLNRSRQMSKDINRRGAQRMSTEYEDTEEVPCQCLRSDCPHCGCMVADTSDKHYQCTWKEFLGPVKPKRNVYVEPKGTMPIQKRDRSDRPKTACIDLINREKRQLMKSNKFIVEAKQPEPKRPRRVSKSFSEMLPPSNKKVRVTEKDYARSHSHQFVNDLRKRIDRASQRGKYDNIDKYMKEFMKASY
ncbi:uncharacterized protein LOC119686236 [Teleopsis dalmanni]|uniref:uncharacterized protein LOC119686236 n=1 Tax=Teleopsis dalmanni TaxID=139649 RepID=UPI0018CF7F1B|nr:uncharacterized protein LOC119686236 [Teleopsis dalmanni]XP_037956691.1 uncharacterized protein LOC119686236 [Teleopsis dalmanni]